MDKETIALVEDVRKSLVKFAKQQTSDSAKKKTRKITSQVIWEPGPYLDELDNILSTSKNKNEAVMRVRSLVRASEEAALDAITLLPDDTGHHKVQSRTGGDDLTELPYQRTGPIIEGLSKKHQMRFGNTTGPDGNLTAELSLSNAAHKFDNKATGLERQSDIGKVIPKAKTAHPKGTAYFANMRGVDMTSDDAVRAALDSKVTEQIAIAETAVRSDAPRQAAVREIIPGAYQGSIEDVAKAKTLITPENTPDLMATYQRLVPGGGSMKFGMSMIAEYGDVIDELTGGAITNVINKAVVNPVRQAVGQEPVGPYQKPDPQADVQKVLAAKEAIQRGPRITFKAGSIKFGMPELGISELLGIN